MILRTLVATRDPFLAAGLGGPIRDSDDEVMAVAVSGAAELAERLRREPFDVVVVDARWLDGPPESWLPPLEEVAERPDVVLLAALDSEVERAAWLARGAAAVLEPTLAPAAVRAALRPFLARRPERALAELRERRETGPVGHVADLAGESPAMRQFLETVRRVVESSITLLLLGETGVGKEVVARAVHAEGPRRAGPFVPVNCAALPEGLLESELFGHVAGAFTGASRARRGIFELADGGVLFLDEVGELPPAVQVKLLRVIQDREFVPVGGERPVRVDVRLMAATNRDLSAEVEAGRFRADLFYRLSVVSLRVPPLRERIEDLPGLVARHVEIVARPRGRVVQGVAPDALEALRRYPWPGNVRELLNVIERAVLLGDDPEIRLEDLSREVRAAARPWQPPAPAPSTAPSTTRSSAPAAALPPAYREAREAVLERFDREYLHALLAATGGRVGAAAALAGLTPRGLYAKMQRLGLRKEDYRVDRERS